MTRKRVASVAIALVAVAALGGCASAPAVAIKAPPVSPTATPAPTAAPVVAPSSRIPLDCTTLVDPALISAVGPTLTVAPAQPESSPYTRQVMREQAGNLNCTWSNPRPAERLRSHNHLRRHRRLPGDHLGRETIGRRRRRLLG